MKTRPILRMICAVCTVVLLLFAFLPTEMSRTNASDWMASLDDTAHLTSLTIPGTHDSGALYSIADVAGKCQSLSVAEQLKAGVRFFDIRLQLRGDTLAVVHSYVDQLTGFEEVMDAMADFLRSHPTEFLLVSIKEDDEPRSPSTTFADAVETMLARYDDVFNPAQTLPQTVADARGTMTVIARYADAAVGIPAYHGWQDNTTFLLGDLFVQDQYAVSGTAEKQDAVTSAFLEAENVPDTLALHFTSCYLTHGYPPISASVPAKTLLPWLADYLRTQPDVRGVLLCDFMTSELAETIWRCNFH